MAEAVSQAKVEAIKTKKKRRWNDEAYCRQSSVLSSLLPAPSSSRFSQVLRDGIR